MRGLSLLPTFLSLFWFSQQCSSFCLVQTSSSRFVHMASTSDLVQSCLVSSFRPPPLAGQQGGWAGVRGATRFPPTISCSSGGGSSGSSGNGISVLGKSLKSAGKKLRVRIHPCTLPRPPCLPPIPPGLAPGISAPRPDSTMQARQTRQESQHVFLSGPSRRGSLTFPSFDDALAQEKLRTAAAFGTDVVLHPLKEILFRRWSRKFIEYSEFPWTIRCRVPWLTLAPRARRFAGGTVDERARWEGKVALVTGGSGGIGMQAAAGLAARGYSVIIACRDAEKGKRYSLDRSRHPSSPPRISRILHSPRRPFPSSLRRSVTLGQLQSGQQPEP